MNKSALGTLWLPMWITDEPTHLLEGRKREKWVGELRNVAHCKRGLTSWRGGRGRNGMVSSEMWHIAKKELACRGRRRGRGGKGRWGRETGEKREQMAVGGGGRSGLVMLEMWNVINEDSLTGGRKEGGVGR